MSEPSATKPSPASMRGASADEQALSQVEKWMATIREINRKPRDGWAGASKALAAAGEGGLV